MEASEKPQLSLGDEPDGTVRALGDRIVIEGLTVDDRRAAEVVRDRAQAGTVPSEIVRKVIEIGARVLDSEETAVNVDYVQRAVESSLGELDKKLEGTLTASAEAINESLADVFEGDESLLAQVQETISKNTLETLQAMSRVLTADDASNPLVNVQKQLAKAMLEAEERNRAEVERLRDSFEGGVGADGAGRRSPEGARAGTRAR